MDNRWNSDEFSEYGAFIIDQMQLELNGRAKTHPNLIEHFSEQVNLEDNREQFAQILQNRDCKGILLQRRVFVTPTLIRYTIAVEEESNRVLRKFSANLPYFIRLTFVTEEICQGYYHSSKPEKNNFILGYIYHIVKDGFKLGGNCEMKFLAYSNSQLKSHSAWFLCERAPWINTEIDASQIAQFMGDFYKEHNILKKHARKGQCFSTSTFVC